MFKVPPWITTVIHHANGEEQIDWLGELEYIFHLYWIELLENFSNSRLAPGIWCWKDTGGNQSQACNNFRYECMYSIFVNVKVNLAKRSNAFEAA